MSEFDELEIADRLPSPPGLCLALLGIANKRGDSRQAIVECVRADPALTGRLISLANGSRAEGSAPVTTARAAAALLDPTVVRDIAVGFNLLPKRPEEICEAFDHRTHWLRSLACAAAAESIARRFETLDPDEAFTLGLLARVGMLAMATVHPSEFAKVLRESEQAGSPGLEAAEIRLLQIDHWQVGADLMEAWGFPRSFLTPIVTLSRSASRGAPAEVEGPNSHSVLTLALQMADEIVAGGEGAAGEIREVREEATHRWKLLVDVCGLRSPVRADSLTPEKSPDPLLPSVVSPISVEAEKNAVARPPTRILIVDDEPSARHLLGLHLRRAGYDVISAADGEAGLAAAISESPQMVITDWLMPGLSGVELCNSLRKTEAGRRMYILVLTSREEEDNVVAGLEAGANDYLTKPFNPRILLARVLSGERVIELQRQVEMAQLIERQRVAEMAKLTRKFRTSANMDALTDLHNRRYAMATLQDAWAASGRPGRTVSVVMVDIDHFKKVNDVHGHQTGDVVLRSTADVLRATCRRNDTVCRLGGEEFLVITSHGSQSEMVRCAERLRSAVEANRIVSGTLNGNVTISLGIAERSPEMKSIDDLLAAADEAMYKAKSQGRNRACVYTAPPRLAQTG